MSRTSASYPVFGVLFANNGLCGAIFLLRFSAFVPIQSVPYVLFCAFAPGAHQLQWFRIRLNELTKDRLNRSGGKTKVMHQCVYGSRKIGKKGSRRRTHRADCAVWLGEDFFLRPLLYSILPLPGRVCHSRIVEFGTRNGSMVNDALGQGKSEAHKKIFNFGSHNCCHGLLLELIPSQRVVPIDDVRRKWRFGFCKPNTQCLAIASLPIVWLFAWAKH